MSALKKIISNPVSLGHATDYPVLGKPILEMSMYLGSYGMGGAGFIGFRLADEHDEERWLVCTVWSADSWLLIDDRVIDCLPDQAARYNPLYQNYARNEKKDEFTPLFAGQPIITHFKVNRRSALLKFRSSYFDAKALIDIRSGKPPLAEHVISFDEAADRRPIFPAGDPRVLDSGDDLRDAWIITNSRYIDI